MDAHGIVLKVSKEQYEYEEFRKHIESHGKALFRQTYGTEPEVLSWHFEDEHTVEDEMGTFVAPATWMLLAEGRS